MKANLMCTAINLGGQKAHFYINISTRETNVKANSYWDYSKFVKKAGEPLSSKPQFSHL